MPNDVHIQMMGSFVISSGDVLLDHLVSKSRKGVSLVEYLILHAEKPVSSQRLIHQFWPGHLNTSPEASLKTLVSRTRALLNEQIPGLGACIVSGQGSYRWQMQPGMWADATEIAEIAATCHKTIPAEERQRLTNRLLEIYQGELFLTGDINDGSALSSWLHREYLDTVYAYVDQLSAAESYNEICRVCRVALKVDPLDEHLHMELMKALVHLNRPGDAMAEYRSLMRTSLRYLDQEPGEDVQALYRQINRDGQQLRFNLDVIRNELMSEDPDPVSPFFCDYKTFKEIYHIQVRNLERLGTTMSLGVIMIGENEGGLDPVRRESAMAGLMEILRQSLRKGDIVTSFSPSLVAMLLPTVNYHNGSVVMERIEQLFREQYPAEKVPFYYRISLLGSNPT